MPTASIKSARPADSRRRIALLSLLLLLSLAPRPVSGEVALKNGNYFTDSTDISYPGGFGLKIERVYNSKTSYSGRFGFGWGTEYEVYIKPSASGGVVVHEYGGGAENEFLPVSYEADEVEGFVHSILAAAFEARDVINSDEAKALEKRIRSGSTALDERLQHYVGVGLIPAPTLPAGTILHSKQFGDQTVVRLADGFRRSSSTGRSESFDANGLLTRVADINGNYVQIRHDTSGRIHSMEDNFGRSMTFVYNAQGLVERIDGENASSVVYRYGDAGDLMYARHADGQEDVYEYDAAGRHNLTSIRSGGKVVEQIAYYPMDQAENVKSVTDGDGNITTYTYDFKSPPRYKVGYKTTAADGSVKAEASYDYTNAVDRFGIERIAEMITVINGDKTDTRYNEYGDPVEVDHGGEVTTSAYDEHGQLTRQETAAQIREQSYVMYGFDKFKIGYVKFTDKTTSPPAVTWSRFSYDTLGNLVHAENSKGTRISISYGDFGQISKMEKPDGTAVAVTYNRDSKATRFQLLKEGKLVGSVDVTYKASGDVDKIVGSDGKDVMEKNISDVIQGSRDLVEPSGVTLTF
jgi:YD repeat-containing protein